MHCCHTKPEGKYNNTSDRRSCAHAHTGRGDASVRRCTNTAFIFHTRGNTFVKNAAKDIGTAGHQYQGDAPEVEEKSGFRLRNSVNSTEGEMSTHCRNSMTRKSTRFRNMKKAAGMLDNLTMVIFTVG